MSHTMGASGAADLPILRVLLTEHSYAYTSVGTWVGSIRMEPRLCVWQSRASVWQVRRTYGDIGGRMASLGGRMAEMGRRMAGLPYV